MKAAGLIAVSALMLAAPLAQAQSQGAGAYLGGGIGRGEIDFDGGSFASNSPNVVDSKISSKTGYAAFGGYDFNRNWAVEGGYTHFGKFNYNYTGTGTIAPTSSAQASYTGSSFWLAGKGTLPVSSAVDLFGKLGLSENRAKDSASSNDPALDAVLGTPYTRNKNHVGLLLGLGGEYHVNKAVGVRVEYDDYGKFGTSGAQNLAHLSMWSADLAYHF